MAVTAFVYSQIMGTAFDEEIDILADTLKVLLATSSHTPDQDADDYHADVDNEVANGNGYTTGGETLGSVTFAYTAGTNTWAHDAADTSWASSSFTARYAIEYDSTPGSSATNPLMSFQNFGGDFTTSSGTFTVAWNASGLWTITIS
ncbi:MAG: hypothetical protein AB7R89_25725 [Dehalococcoidia bacterium]